MASVRIHCYGCGAQTMVAESRMAEDLRYAGWSVTHGQTYCRACAAERGLTAGTEPQAPDAGDPTRPDVPQFGSSPLPAGCFDAPLNESRLARTLRLMRTALDVLRRDPRLLIFPSVAIVANLVIGAGALALAVAQAGGVGHAQHAIAVWSVVASFPATYVTIFCGVALACMLASHLDGYPMDVSAAWRAAAQRGAVILAWTLLVCTVGLLLRIIEQSLPRIVVVLIDVSWALLTVFAVPVLAYEQLGPIATFRRSGTLLRQRWGEQIGGAIGIGIASGLLTLPCIVAVVLGLLVGGAGGVLLVGLGAVALVVLSAAQVAVGQVFRVCLYRYAVGADAPGTGPFAAGDMERPFVRRRRLG